MLYIPNLFNEFGVSDVSVSLPTIIGSNGAKKVLLPNMTEAELKLFRESTEACKAVLRECK